MDKVKFWVAIIGGAATTAVGLLGADTTAGKVLMAILAGLTAAGVYQLPNSKLPPNGTAK